MSRMMTASSGTITPMNRRNPRTGELFQVTPERDEYCVPPAGTYGRFKLTGISDTFRMESPKYGPSINVRLEFLIMKVQDPEEKYLESRRFVVLITWASISIDKVTGEERQYLSAKMTKFLGALRGRPIEGGEDVDPDAYIDTEIVTATTLKPSADGSKQYPNIAIESIAANKTVLSKYVTAPRQPALVPAGGVDDDLEDPFPQDISDDGL